MQSADSPSPNEGEGARGCPSPRRLIGREHEEAEIAGLPATVRNGLSAALVLRGETGVSKTALVEAAAGAAADLEILRPIGTYEVVYLAEREHVVGGVPSAGSCRRQWARARARA